MTFLREMALKRFVGHSRSLRKLSRQVFVLFFVSVHLFLDVLVGDVVSEIKVRYAIQDLVHFFLEFVFYPNVLGEGLFVLRIVLGFIVGHALIVYGVIALVLSKPSPA